MEDTLFKFKDEVRLGLQVADDSVVVKNSEPMNAGNRQEDKTWRTWHKLAQSKLSWNI